MCDKETRKPFCSCFTANSISHSLHIFPRRPTELFDYYINTEFNYLNDQMKYYVSIKEPYRLRNFCESGSTEIPAIPHFDESKKSVKLKERDFYVFENNSFSSEFTVCFLHKDKKSGLYSYFDPMNKSMYDDDFKNYALKLSVKKNETERRIFFVYHKENCSWWPCDTSNPKKFYEYSKRYIAYFKIIFDGNRENKEDPEEKKIVIEAEAVNGDMKKKCELTLIYSTYKGWTLTKKGELKQGGTGWLFDEKGYYILEDGRRVDEGILKENKYKEDEIRVGDKDAGEGFKKILEGGKTEQADNSETNPLLENIRCKYDVYDDILKNHHKAITNLVSMQAFQISACYNGKHSETAPLSLGGNAKFYSIGTDETDIPIVVTEIKGAESPVDPKLTDSINSQIRAGRQKKLVIASPHGDERNAQRLIMAAQKYFIQDKENKVPDDTIMYFIPCLSPTMTFADARGIPNEFLINGGNIITIHGLHEAVNQTMRDRIQRQTDPINPQYGVDANRDYHKKLDSSRVFISFIDTLKDGLDVRDSNMDIVETRILYQNKKIDANPVEIDKVEGKTIKNIRVFMIHGCVDNVSVYGPYSVSGKDNAGRDGKIAANISEQDRIRVDEIMQKLRVTPFRRYTYDIDDYFYGDTKTNAAKYQGEWTVQLYNKQIWAADIELSSNYNEGIRYFGKEEEIEKAKYTPSKIGLRSLPYFQDNNNRFYDLLRNFV